MYQIYGSFVWLSNSFCMDYLKLWTPLFHFETWTIKIPPSLREISDFIPQSELAVRQEVENTFSSDNIITTRQKKNFPPTGKSRDYFVVAKEWLRKYVSSLHQKETSSFRINVDKSLLAWNDMTGYIEIKFNYVACSYKNEIFLETTNFKRYFRYSTE